MCINNHISLFIERNIKTNKLRVVKFGLIIADDEEEKILNEMVIKFRVNDSLIMTYGIIEP